MKEQLYGKETRNNIIPDMIFVLSSGLHSSKVSTNKVKPSWDARMRLVAAVDMVERLNGVGHSPLVVITGGNVYEDQPELSSIGKQKLVDCYQLPESQVMTRSGTNTVEEFEIIEKLIKEQGLEPHNVAVISSGYHLTAKTLSEQLGVSFFSAEEILFKRDRRYQKVIGDIIESDHYQNLLKSQNNRSKITKVPLGKTFYKIADRWIKRNVELAPFDHKNLKNLFGQ